MSAIANVYESVYLTLANLCKKIADSSPIPLTIVSFDEMVNSEEFQTGTLIGLWNWAYRIEDEGLSVNFNIGVSTSDDPGLAKLNQLCGILGELLVPGNHVYLLDSVTRTETKVIMSIMDPVMALPVDADRIRNTKFFNVIMDSQGAVTFRNRRIN